MELEKNFRQLGTGEVIRYTVVLKGKGKVLPRRLEEDLPCPLAQLSGRGLACDRANRANRATASSYFVSASFSNVASSHSFY